MGSYRATNKDDDAYLLLERLNELAAAGLLVMDYKFTVDGDGTRRLSKLFWATKDQMATAHRYVQEGFTSYVPWRPAIVLEVQLCLGITKCTF